MIDIKKLPSNSFMTNCYVVSDHEGHCIVIDPSFYDAEEKKALDSYLERKGVKPSAILLTHGHFDHVFGVAALQAEYGIPAYMHAADRPVINYNAQAAPSFGLKTPEAFGITEYEDGEMIAFGDASFEVIHTPGHTPGCVSLLYHSSKENDGQKFVFTGDTLFAGAIGRTDLPMGDYDKEMESIFTRLLHLEGDTVILPGHGPDSTIADERMKNPFLLPFNEPYEED